MAGAAYSQFKWGTIEKLNLSERQSEVLFYRFLHLVLRHQVPMLDGQKKDSKGTRPFSANQWFWLIQS